MNNFKKFKTIDLTTNQLKLYKHYRYFTEIMINHAIQCRDKRCWCNGSSFNDALADFKHDAPDNIKREIEEIFVRYE